MKSKHDASASLEGYLYQVEVALSITLAKMKTEHLRGDCFDVYIERFDDISFGVSDVELGVEQVIQVKNKSKTLTDKSRDIWGTFEIWLGMLDFKRSQFILLTTQEVSQNSIFSRLTSLSRTRVVNEEIAQDIMDLNHSNHNAFRLFMSLEFQERVDFVESVFFLVKMPSNQEINQGLRKSLMFLVEMQDLDAACDQLKGWWYSRVSEIISNKNTKAMISSSEVMSEIDSIRSNYAYDFFLNDNCMAGQIEADVNEYMTAVFISQMGFVGYKDIKTLAKAIDDYKCALATRVDWEGRRSTLFKAQVSFFEDELVRVWESIVEEAKDQLSDDSDETLQKIGRHIYRTAMKRVQVFPRSEPGGHNTYGHKFTRGSYHILAEGAVVGWHLEYQEKLKSILNLNEDEVEE